MRVDGLAVGSLVRIDGNEIEMPVIVDLELPERHQFADLATGFVEREGTTKRLELSRKAEHGAVYFELIEACRHRQRLLDDQPGRIAGNGVETPFNLAVRVLFVPSRSIVRKSHAEVDRIFDIRGRHVGEYML